MRDACPRASAPTRGGARAQVRHPDSWYGNKRHAPVPDALQSGRLRPPRSCAGFSSTEPAYSPSEVWGLGYPQGDQSGTSRRRRRPFRCSAHGVISNCGRSRAVALCTACWSTPARSACLTSLGHSLVRDALTQNESSGCACGITPTMSCVLYLVNDRIAAKNHGDHRLAPPSPLNPTSPSTRWRASSTREPSIRLERARAGSATPPRFPQGNGKRDRRLAPWRSS